MTTTNRRNSTKGQMTTNMLILAALDVAQHVGYTKMTREQIARRARLSTGAVSQRLGTMDKVRRAVMRHAVITGNVAVLAQGLALRDPHALKAPQELKDKAAGSVSA